MFSQNSSSRTQSKGDRGDRSNSSASNRALEFDPQQELDLLEEIILESFRVPLVRWTLIDEDKLLNQLDLVRMNLPEAFEKAVALLRKKQEILAEAEEYAQRIIQSAQHRAAQILDETGIIQQAQAQANQIRQQVQQDCDAIQRQTLSEIEQMRYKAQQELQQMYQQTQAECAQIQDGADEYADRVLGSIEQQLGEMLSIVRNGRQQLTTNPVSRRTVDKKLPGKN
ncbi:MAG: DivIVA domain-containing protein [Hydrococcus sp. Prado102]|jgi:F0F1-type ATP synthase membrane subunit b/b'|nr:DivIVA domain-containing protein [Hydrococcus sp. Prado102]